MELVHEFTVAVPVERAWDVLTDVERIAPCMPGAELTGVDGGTYHGQVKIKVGPITAQYKGTASFAERTKRPAGPCSRRPAGTPAARAPPRPR